MSNNLFGPANSPIFSPPAQSGPTKVTVPPRGGIPAGGSAGQVLAKKSGTDYDAEWIDAGGGGGATMYTWSWPGQMTTLYDVFQVYVAPNAANLNRAYIMYNGGTATLTFNIVKNFVVVGSFSRSSNGYQAINVPLNAGDTLKIVPTSIGNGGARNVLISLMEFTA